MALAILVVVVAACGDSAANQGPRPPYASPKPLVPAAINSRGCEQVKLGNAPNGTATVKVQLVKPGTDLQRINDDLAGLVPGGNASVDATIASHDADQFYAWALSANLCEPLKSQLVEKAKAMQDAFAALASGAGGPDAATALQTAQAAHKAVSDLADNPPAS